MLAAFHSRSLACVDMSKWGEILMVHDGGPCLLDHRIYRCEGFVFRGDSRKDNQTALGGS